MLTFILDLVLGLLVGGKAWSTQKTLVASLIAGEIAAFAITLLAVAIGSAPFSATGGVGAIALLGAVHGILVFAFAMIRRRRVKRGFGA